MSDRYLKKLKHIFYYIAYVRLRHDKNFRLDVCELSKQTSLD